MEEVRRTVRLPRELVDQLDAEATRDSRSKNAEIVVLLREALDARRRRDQK